MEETKSTWECFWYAEEIGKILLLGGVRLGHLTSHGRGTQKLKKMTE